MSDTEFSTRQQRLNEVIAEYFAVAESGQAPDQAEFIRRHAPFENELREFFRDNQAFEQMARTLSIARGVGSASEGTINSVPAGEVSARTAAPGQRIRYFGDYELAEEIARGGMGIVYKARQISLNRFVALKMILSGQFASREEVVRFRTEAESAASLDHPNIIPIHEVGEYHAQHYFTMKLIDGGNIGQWALAQKPDQRRIAAMMVTVARAVHFGHQRGVLHRDLKPGNVLVDSAGVPYVVDFGIARRVDTDHGLTLTTDVLGSPAYMAPEQAAGKPRQISVATDVYGLGAILYYLLAGRAPFIAESAAQTLRLVLEAEPARPRAVQPRIDADLQTICLKCLEKDPAKRFATAQSVADDLQRWLDGKPIVARPASRAERVVKWARRRPSLAALIAVSIIAAAVLAGVLSMSDVRVRLALAQETAAGQRESVALTHETAARQRETAALQESRDRLVQTSVTRGIEAIDADDPGAALLWFAKALRDETHPDRQRVLRTRITLGLRQLPRIHSLLIGDPPLCFTPDGKALIRLGGANLQPWDGHGFEGTRLVRHDLANPEPVFPPVASPSATQPGSGGAVANQPLTDVNGGLVFTDITAPVTRLIQSVDVQGGVTITFWDVMQLKPLGKTDVLPARPWHVCYNADGSRAAVLYDEPSSESVKASRGVVRSFNVNTGAELGPPITVTSICWLQMDPAGKQIVTVSGDDQMKQANVWDIATANSLFKAPLGQNSLIRPGSTDGEAIFSPDGNRLLTLWGGSGAGVMRTWDLRNSKPLGDEQFFTNLEAFGGRQFVAAAGGFDKFGVWVNQSDTVSFRYAESGQPFAGISPGGSVEAIAYAPLGEMIATIARLGDGSAVRIWSPDMVVHRPLTPQMIFGQVHRVLFSPDAKRLAVTAGEAGGPLVTQVRDTIPPAEQSRYAQFPVSTSKVLALSPDGHRAIALIYPRDNTEKARLEIMNYLTGKSLVSSLAVGYQVRAAFSPDGSRIAVLKLDETPFEVAVLSSEDGKPTLAPFHPKDPNTMGCFIYYSTDGQWIITDNGQPDWGSNLIRSAWNAASGAKLEFPQAHNPNLSLICFSDDCRLALLADKSQGKWVSSQYGKQDVRVWDVATRKAASPSFEQEVDCACFGPDGRQLLIYGRLPSNQNALSLYDVATGRQVWSILMPESAQQLAFSPDGSKIAVWKTNAIEIRSSVDRSASPLPIKCFANRYLGSMRFSADGRLLIAWNTTDSGHRTGIYDVRTSEPLETFDLQAPFQSEAPPVFPRDDHMTIVRDFRPIDVDLAADMRDPATLDLAIQLLSGRKLQSNGLLAPLGADELVKSWRSLEAAGAPEVGEPGKG